jgi:hypothetical protein
MKKRFIIKIVEDKKPLPLSLVMQPIPKEFKNVRIAIPPTGDFHTVSNLSTTLLEPSCITGMDPKHPCRR